MKKIFVLLFLCLVTVASAEAKLGLSLGLGLNVSSEGQATDPSDDAIDVLAIDGIYAWFDPTDSIVSSSGDVSEYTNKVSGSPDLVEATYPPKTGQATIFGRPAITADGVDDRMTGDLSSHPMELGDLTIHFSTNIPTFTGVSGVPFSFHVGSTDRYDIYFTEDREIAVYNKWDTVNQLLTSSTNVWDFDTDHVITWEYDESIRTIRVYVDNVLVLNDNTNIYTVMDNQFTELLLFEDVSPPNEFEGSIGEVIIIEGIPTDEERAEQIAHIQRTDVEVVYADIADGSAVAGNNTAFSSSASTLGSYVRRYERRHWTPKNADYSDIQFTLCNYNVNQNGDNTSNMREQNVQFVLVEDPDGTPVKHRATFGGQNIGIVEVGECINTDPIDITLTADTEFAEWFMHYASDDSAIAPTGIPVRSGYGEGVGAGTNESYDLESASFTSVNSEGWGATAIFGTPSVPVNSLFIAGDSIARGYGAGDADGVDGNRGIIERANNNEVGYINASYPSGLAGVWEDPTEFTRVFTFIESLPEGTLTHAIWGGSTNDIAAGIGLGTVTGYVEDIFTRFRDVGLLVSAHTLMPYTTLTPDVDSTATGGSTTTVIDTSQSWTVDEWAGYSVRINGSRRTITSNTSDTLTFSTIFGMTDPTGDDYVIDDNDWDAEGKQVARSQFASGAVADQYNEDLLDGTIVTDFQVLDGRSYFDGIDANVWRILSGSAEATYDGIHPNDPGLDQAQADGLNMDWIKEYDPFTGKTLAFDLYPRRDLATANGTAITSGTVAPSISIVADAARAPEYYNTGSGYLIAPDGSTELETSTAITPVETRTEIYIFEVGDNPTVSEEIISIGSQNFGDQQASILQTSAGAFTYGQNEAEGYPVLDGSDNENSLMCMILEYNDSSDVDVYINGTLSISFDPHDEYFDSDREYYHLFSRFSTDTAPENMKLFRLVRINSTLASAGITASQICDYADATFN